MGVTTIPTTSRRRSRRSPVAGSRRSRSPMIAPSSWSRSSSSRSGALRRGGRCTGFARVKREVDLGDLEVAQCAGGRSGAGAAGSIPITTSGKVRRSACAERYRQDEFSRLDVRYDGAFDEPHFVTGWSTTWSRTIGCSPDDDRPGSVAERPGSRVARRGGALAVNCPSCSAGRSHRWSSGSIRRSMRWRGF